MDIVGLDLAAEDKPAPRRRPIRRGATAPRAWLNPGSRRHDRPYARGRDADTALDQFNERQEDRLLHPTKGFRRVNVRRSRAQMLVAMILDGQRISTARMGRFVRDGML